MMNFWISLYVTIVIVVSGSIVIGSDATSERVQISRIGSQNLTQVVDANLPSRFLEQTLPTPPDEQ